MQRFVWDPDKRRANLAKHGVDFDEARAAFRDPHFYARLDVRFDYGEERIVGIGFAGGRLLTVAFVEQGDTIRIISARRAAKIESDAYFTAPR